MEELLKKQIEKEIETCDCMIESTQKRLQETVQEVNKAYTSTKQDTTDAYRLLGPAEDLYNCVMHLGRWSYTKAIFKRFLREVSDNDVR